MKKILIIFFVFLAMFSIDEINAAEKDESAATTVIKKNGKYSPVGSVYTTYKYKSESIDEFGNYFYKYFSSESAKDNFCNKKNNICANIQKRNGSAYICTRDGSSNNTQYYSSKSSCEKECTGRIASAGYKCESVEYYVTYRNATVTEKEETKYKTEPITGNQYSTTSGDDAYCINPGRRFQDNAKYCLVDEFDVSSCKSSNDSDYRCGLAWIMMQNVDEDGNNAGKYSYGEILTALRLWTAYKSNLSGMDNFGNESDDINYVADSNFYSVTAKKVASGYSGAACTEDKSTLGIICSGVEGYKKSFELFELARQGQEVKIPGQQGDEVKLKTTEITNNTEKIEVEIPFDLDNPIFAEYKDKISMELMKYNAETKTWEKVAGGKEHTECQKNYCQLVVKELVCDAKETYYSTEWKVKITIEDYNVGGLVRQYVHCSNPEKYQIMMVLATSKNKCGEPGQPACEEFEQKGDYVTEPEITVNCLKDCEDGEDGTCPNSEMIVRSDTPLTCEGSDSYTKGEKKDPYMNCILNACDPVRKEQFDKSKEYGVNTNTCRIYCREEIDFYLANKTQVYAGMQFRYDLASKNITDKGKSITPFTVDQKLSAVVMQRRQCTSEIYYDRSPKEMNPKNEETRSWITRYDAAVKDMITAWNAWKRWEALYDWQMKNCGKPQQVQGKAKTCAYGSNECGNNTCELKNELSAINYIYFWPNQTISDNFNGCGSATSSNKVSYNNTSLSRQNLKDGYSVSLSSSNKTTSASSGSFNCGSTTCGSASCCSSMTCSCGNADPHAKPPRPDTMNCCCNSTYSTNGSPCSSGQPGNIDLVKNEENAKWNEYVGALNVVAQLLYDLQNCNMYVSEGSGMPANSDKIIDYYEKIESAYHGSKNTTVNKVSEGSTKNRILKDAAETIMELFIEYDDVKYGDETKFENATKALEEDFGTQYCVNSSTNKNESEKNTCYEYTKGGGEKEIEGDNTAKNHALVECSGVGTNAKCTTKNISLPTNDYATFISVTETDFWQPKQYHTKVYTGEVLEGTGDGMSSADLGSNVFPVSNDKTSGKTGEYGIHWKFTDVGEYDFTRLREFLYECTYEVFNTTTLYDCDYVDEDGNIDWEKCKNTCFEVNETVPKVCIDNDFDNDTKGYGFIYRNVDLKDLFPNREPGFNWDNSTNIIESIQASSDDIWTNEYLEYSFTLDTQAIRNIRNYNDTKQGLGGYLDNSIYSCELEGDAFKNCRSSFLEDHNLNDGLGIEINKNLYGGIY